MLQNYYFTFGSDQDFPFQNGWIVVQAPSAAAAIDIFCSYYPRRGECINCSFMYEEEAFINTEMYKRKDNLGAGCHCIIGPHPQDWNNKE